MHLVLRKQIHICRKEEGGCAKEAFAAMGILMTFSLSLCASLSRGLCVLYHRPYRSYRNVVPLHPRILYLWRGHKHLQRVTQDSWSFYMLEYSLKTEPMGQLTFNTNTVSRLGLSDSPQFRLFSNLITAHPVSPCEKLGFVDHVSY